MMGKLKGVLMTAVLSVFIFTGIAFASENVKLVLNGDRIIPDVPPVLEQGTTLVPIRVISQEMGASVNYYEETQQVIINQSDVHIELTIGKVDAKVNGRDVKLLSPAKILRGRTMVPLRFISEAFGANVDWNGTTKTVTITSATNIPFSWRATVKDSTGSTNKTWKSASDNVRDVEGEWYLEDYLPHMTFDVVTDAQQQVARKPLESPALPILFPGYESQFLLYAYLGEAPSEGYDIHITEVRQVKNLVYVYVKMTGPKPGTPVGVLPSYPYEIAKVQKENLTQRGELTFIFMDQDNGKELARIPKKI